MGLAGHWLASRVQERSLENPVSYSRHEQSINYCDGLSGLCIETLFAELNYVIAHDDTHVRRIIRVDQGSLTI